MDCIIKKESHNLVYYEDGSPCHRGVISIDGKIYYAGRHGILFFGRKYVHTEMLNGILSSHGYYKFSKKGVAKKKLHKGINVVKLKKKIKKKHKKVMLYSLLVILVCLCVVSTLIFNKKLKEHNKGNNTTNSDLIVDISNNNSKFYLVSDNMVRYYNYSYSLTEIGLSNPYVPYKFNYSISVPNNNEFSLDDVTATYKLSTNSSLDSYVEYQLDVKEKQLIIDNLIPNTTYYYKVDITYPNGTKNYDGSFETGNTNRFVKIPGLYNTRDIGGYITLDGKKVSYNKIIRGPETDGLSKTGFFLKTAELEKIMETFNFTYELDLRSSSIHSYNYVSSFGNNVGHDFYNGPKNGELFDIKYKQSIINIFNSLANPDNYPMYLHCSDGCDQTGTIIYLLDAILDLSNSDKNREYGLSCLYSPNVSSNNLRQILYGLNINDVSDEETNNTIKEWLVNTIGISQETIDSIRDILLEEAE